MEWAQFISEWSTICHRNWNDGFPQLNSILGLSSYNVSNNYTITQLANAIVNNQYNPQDLHNFILEAKKICLSTRLSFLERYQQVTTSTPNALAPQRLSTKCDKSMTSKSKKPDVLKVNQTRLNLANTNPENT